MIRRTELAPGLIVEEHDVELLPWWTGLRVWLVFAAARLLRVPIAIRDEFYDPALTSGSSVNQKTPDTDGAQGVSE